MRTVADGLDLSKPPFRLNAAQDSRAVAEDFIACFQVVAQLPDKVGTCFRAALEAGGLAPTEPLCVAGQRIAGEMDAGVGAAPRIRITTRNISARSC
jgi:hypothetical protein